MSAQLPTFEATNYSALWHPFVAAQWPAFVSAIVSADKSDVATNGAAVQTTKRSADKPAFFPAVIAAFSAADWTADVATLAPALDPTIVRSVDPAVEPTHRAAHVQ